MQKMKADKAFTYRAVDLCVGQEFDCDDADVKVLSTVGFAHVERGQEYDTRVLTAGHNLSSRRRAMRKAAAS